MFNLVSGLKTDHSMFNTYEDASDVEALCKESKNQYLRYTDEEVHKIYFDIDMDKHEYEQLGDYETVNNKLLKFLIDTFSEHSNLSIATASQLDKKLSFRVVFNDFKLKIKDMKEWVKNIKNEFIDDAYYFTNSYIKDNLFSDKNEFYCFIENMLNLINFDPLQRIDMSDFIKNSLFSK